MDERRIETRRRVNTPVRLYHPELGRVDGVINDISDGGAAIKLNSYKNLSFDPAEASLFLRPINLDVLFSVACLRQQATNVAVRFLE